MSMQQEEQENSKNISSVFLKKKPTGKILYNLIKSYPNLKEIIICEGMKKYVKKFQHALQQVGIKITFKRCKKGRKRSQLFEKFRSMLSKGLPIKKIIERLNISKRTAYYWRAIIKNKKK